MSAVVVVGAWNMTVSSSCTQALLLIWAEILPYCCMVRCVDHLYNNKQPTNLQ